MLSLAKLTVLTIPFLFLSSERQQVRGELTWLWSEKCTHFTPTDCEAERAAKEVLRKGPIPKHEDHEFALKELTDNK